MRVCGGSIAKESRFVGEEIRGIIKKLGMGNSSAFTELFIYFIYFALGFGAIIYLLAFLFVEKKKIIHLLVSIISGVLFILYFKSMKDGYKKQQLEYVGSYHLKHYPNCKYCTLTLKEGNTYEVKDSSKILEVGDWHYETGGDAFIVYMNKDEDRLGVGRFDYWDLDKK